MRTLYLCGASNPEGVRLALRVDEAEDRWDRLVLLDDDPDRHGTEVLGVPVAGPFALLATADPGADEVVNLVARTTAGRQAARERIAAFGMPFAGLIHPGVDIEGAELAADAIVYRNATIGPHARVGESTVVFMGGVVGHGSTVGHGCVIAPNAVVNARVTIGDRVYVGTNASILPDLWIGADATLGAGSAVMCDVPFGTTVMGVPAKALPTPSARRDPPVGVGAVGA